MGYVGNIEEVTEQNSNFRKVVFTGHHLQLVAMSLKPGEDIGEEVHPKVDQFFRIEKGEGKVIMDGQEQMFTEGFAIVVPSGTYHNIVNTSSTEDLKLYTIYTPANHIDGIVHVTKEDALNDKEDEAFSEKVNA
ncbi:MAG TPA: cupin domain-containing protein [Candidatus Dojkabacteria bacterium]|jgi:mannose-6-phosphate isomerase-like protein (cupin superfamily)|nr:cupin domain-containing protein [Methanofastidiosum sp.]HPQ79577.1 cupin domain-containing protein [Candidatus Dojkabacteria bacterium]